MNTPTANAQTHLQYRYSTELPNTKLVGTVPTWYLSAAEGATSGLQSQLSLHISASYFRNHPKMKEEQGIAVAPDAKEKECARLPAASGPAAPTATNRGIKCSSRGWL